MTMHPLPPQAYTKDTLVKAYQWLQGQSAHIKELATNPDVLVSLYQKARLQGEASLERPSIQNFKAELKNLAGMMGEFEVYEDQGQNRSPAAPPAPPQMTSVSSSASSNLSVQQGQVSPPRGSFPFDAKSLAMIQEVKAQLNLSSDQEALRVLISIGHAKVKSLLS